jgi:tRNA(Ile)-lysidine synthase
VINVDVKRLFETEPGAEIYRVALQTIKQYNMEPKLLGGVIVGFSGGADSVMLLCVLKRYAEENGVKKLCAVHLNHMIRGAEAERDETFSYDFSAALGVEFLSYKKDIPSEAKRLSKGLEETARCVRYSIFEELLQSRNDISCIAVAHNATDNMETIIFNMMRGSGTLGLSGIPPVRDEIIRPLIAVPKRDIISALNGAEIPFVVDSTNLQTDYQRNFIRAEILPKLRTLAQNPEAQATRLSENLRCDNAFILSEAESFLDNCGKTVPAEKLSNLSAAVFNRVLSVMAKQGGSSGVERTHIVKVYELLKAGGDFSVSLPGGVSFICKRRQCSVDKAESKKLITYEKKLGKGINFVPEIDAQVIVSDKPIDNFSSKVYKIAIQRAIDFDIIKGDLLVREKRDGDSYVYGGMTHKLKKLFNDKSIPSENRSLIPVICDGDGILWVPGFSVRDGGNKNSESKIYIAVAYKA